MLRCDPSGQRRAPSWQVRLFFPYLTVGRSIRDGIVAKKCAAAAVVGCGSSGSARLSVRPSVRPLKDLFTK